MATQKKQVMIRVQPDTYEKMKIISDKNHRSVSNQMEWLMLKFIADYETQNGLISLFNENGRNREMNNNFVAYGGNNSVNQSVTR